jgi:hypothetical protein
MPPSQLSDEFEDIWELLRERLWPSLRARINAHPGAVIAVAVGSTVLLLIIVVLLLTPDKRPPVQDIETEWYYDLNTGKLFTAAKGLTPPIDAPSGPQPNGEPAGVRAYVLSYSHASDKSGRYIGFLETSAPKDLVARWPTRPAHTNPASNWGRGKLIRRVEDKNWALADSKEGRQIFNEAFAPNADGERPISCPPE